jgi:transposase
MDARKQRGLEIAERARIRKTTGGWIVPSQNAGASVKYAVIMGEGVKPSCTCPDYELRADRCKHIYAVEYVIQRELFPDGRETVTETVRVTETLERKTYPQNWRAYNKAQTTEKDHFMVLLRDLCAGLPEPAPKRGRPRVSLRDAVFTAVMKVYTTQSARRCMSDLREAKERGYISKLPCHNSVLNALESPDMTSILHDLIVESSLPLKAVECDFAVDSSGFTTSRFESWHDNKWGGLPPRRRHTWVKAHVMCGTKTNIVTAVEIHEKNAADVKQLPALVQQTARNFAVAEVSADKAYGSVKNADAIMSVGGTPFIALKSNNTGRDVYGSSAWGKMFGYFMYRREEFLAHYHKRSNVETTFSMIKRKFGDSLRSKTPTAQVNETLAKILCHNLVVLIHEACELGIAPAFWGDRAV